MEFTVEEINDFLEKSYFYNIKIDIFKLPDFLKKSKLYDEKYKDIADGKIISDNLIEIDSKYFCDSFEIDSLKKLYHVLNVIKYWGIYEIPYSLYDFANKFENSEYGHDEEFLKFQLCENILDKFSDLDVVDDLKTLLVFDPNSDNEMDDGYYVDDNSNENTDVPVIKKKHIDPKRLLFIRISNFCLQGRLNLLKYYNYKFGNDYENLFSHENLKSAISSSDLETVKFISSKIKIESNEEFCNDAVKSGNLNILTFILSLENCYASKNICDFAAEYGSLNCLIYFYEKGYEINEESMLRAVRNENLDCLKYIYKIKDQIKINFEKCSSWAAINNKIEVLKFLDENKIKFEDNIIVRATETGNFELFKYCYNKCGWPDDKINTITRICARDGHFKILKFAHENGCKWDNETCNYAILMGNMDCLEYAHNNGCYWDEEAYINFMKLHCNSRLTISYIEYLRSYKCPWNEKVFKYAVESGYTICIDYLLKNGCPHDKNISNYYIKSVDCLEYLHKNNFKWDETTCSNFTKFGAYDCLVYANKNGCPWDKRTCELADETGVKKVYNVVDCKWEDKYRYPGKFYECIKYAHENGCPFSENTIKSTVMRSCIDSLEYAHKNGCELTVEAFEEAKHNNFYGEIRKNILLDYFKRNGFK